MDPNLQSMNELILAKMREGVERMDAPQAVDEVRGMKAEPFLVRAVWRRQSQPCHFQPRPSSSPPARFALYTTRANRERMFMPGMHQLHVTMAGLHLDKTAGCARACELFSGSKFGPICGCGLFGQVQCLVIKKLSTST
jgi:hypothetical protein